ncbi:MAG: type II toxin-antitoxin system HicB family antitoxin [Pseudonocardiaceae bacterium]
MESAHTYTVRIHDDGRDGLWAQIDELPGLFASGDSEDELYEAIAEAVGFYLSETDHPIAARWGGWTQPPAPTHGDRSGRALVDA